MTSLSKRVAFATFVLLVLGITGMATGVPLRWTKGVAVSRLCMSTEANYVCQVELVPDGTRVTAESESDLTAGEAVELRVWHDLVTGRDTYKVVR